MIITFCGHSNASFTAEETKLIFAILEQKIRENHADTFYLGDYGDFDRLCYIALTTLKKSYPNIKLIFITPYIDTNYSKMRNAKDKYDEIIFPPLEQVPKRLAISKRNEWMVDNADFVIAYVKYSWGGASKTLEYAKRKGKPYINIANIICQL